MDPRHFERLRWRCRRGQLELDLMLGSFLQGHYPALPASEQETFERLLELPDTALQSYLQGQETPAKEFEEIVRKIRQ